MIALLAASMGFALRAIMLGYAAFGVGLLFLSFMPGGIHTDWIIVVLLGNLVCLVSVELQGLEQPSASSNPGAVKRESLGTYGWT